MHACHAGNPHRHAKQRHSRCPGWHWYIVQRGSDSTPGGRFTHNPTLRPHRVHQSKPHPRVLQPRGTSSPAHPHVATPVPTPCCCHMGQWPVAPLSATAAGGPAGAGRLCSTGSSVVLHTLAVEQQGATLVQPERLAHGGLDVQALHVLWGGEEGVLGQHGKAQQRQQEAMSATVFACRLAVTSKVAVATCAAADWLLAERAATGSSICMRQLHHSSCCLGDSSCCLGVSSLQHNPFQTHRRSTSLMDTSTHRQPQLQPHTLAFRPVANAPSPYRQSHCTAPPPSNPAPTCQFFLSRETRKLTLYMMLVLICASSMLTLATATPMHSTFFSWNLMEALVSFTWGGGEGRVRHT